VAKVESFFHRVDDTVPALFGKAEVAINRGVASVALKAVVAVVPRMLGGQSDRVRLVVPNDKLQALKIAATPPPETGGDGWVSTQEAVVAHLLLSLWTTFMGNASFLSGGCARVSFLVDVRRFLGLAENFSFGTGFQVVDLYIKDMANKTLSQCAADIHEGSRSLGEHAMHKWHLWHHAFEDCVRLERFVRDSVSHQSTDLTLTVNNNSKREAPHFGDAGGLATSFMSSMGPTLLLTTTHGLEIILDHDLYASASEAKKKEFQATFSNLP
jgi:hypothetical protein